MDQQEQAHNEQQRAPDNLPYMVYIYRTDTPQPMYFSEKIGRDFGSPHGGWSEGLFAATIMTKDQAEERLNTSLASIAPMCKLSNRLIPCYLPNVEEKA